LQRFFDVYYEPVAEQLFAYDDAQATLAEMKQSGKTVGLISNTIFPERVHKDELDRFGLTPFIDFMIFSSSFGLRKPHPDIFRKAVEHAGQDPVDCVYIGDRYVEDITGPASIGMPAILKRWDGREYPNPLPEKLRTIRTLSELNRHLA
jgi:HAD superfamily hydrolase (TIGR01549 family)